MSERSPCWAAVCGSGSSAWRSRLAEAREDPAAARMKAWASDRFLLGGFQLCQSCLLWEKHRLLAACVVGGEVDAPQSDSTLQHVWLSARCRRVQAAV